MLKKRLPFLAPCCLIFFLFFLTHGVMAEREKNYQWIRSQTEVQISEIIVSLSEQKIYAYGTNGKLVGTSIISSGKENFSTPAGEYQIIEKEKIHYSNLYGYIVDRYGNILKPGSSKERISKKWHFRGAPMPYFLRLTKSGIGIHGGPTTGRPISHGCIRLPMDFAAKLFTNTPLHTRVLVFD
ncbi:L,D-transpeptidase-like protein [Methylacidiphilum kamchatkense Kam1]|uniref:L,D-transpeptidase-like protein n=2 Tax=Methylacidiphilum kamchatkense TaxID=431057 RepID=A0A516TKY6_9BACT|nr:L,D-transpeptidase-like protein [Methylacidiphilum kamchatkense Kam1]